jgi:hypothetical protein
MRKNWKYSFMIVIAWVVSLSCEDKELPQNCGCGSSTIGTFADREASYLGDGQFVLMPLDSTGSYTFGWACQIDSTWRKSEAVDSRDYLISADWKQRCLAQHQNHYSMAPLGNFLDITSLIKK